MGFRVDATFLRFITMAALTSRRVMELMVDAGLQPIELERHASATEIWSTKVKRLRVPDLLCVKTGQRVEVRARSELKIRMTDAPGCETRRWFTGLRPDDLVAFVHCPMDRARLVPAHGAEFFRVRDLQAVPESATKLEPPVSTSSNAECFRTWPSIVPTQSGLVTGVTADTLHTLLDDGKEQAYALDGMTPYVQPGERFSARCQFIAGLPERASLDEVSGQGWDPRLLLEGDLLDQYVAAKALETVGWSKDVALLERLYECAGDPRVSLESAGSMAKLGARDGLRRLLQEVRFPRIDYLRMEAVLLLSELNDTPLRNEAAAALAEIATEVGFAGQEIRQAAIWGLGRTGLGDYSRLVPLLDAQDKDERMYAVVAMGEELPVAVVDRLVGLLGSDATSQRQRASCLHVLKTLAHPHRAIIGLSALAKGGSALAKAWAKAALGSMPPERLQGALEDPQLLSDILALQLLSEHNNWTATEGARDALSFMRKQTVSEAS